MIQLINIKKSYKDNLALSNINLEIQRGEMVFLTGHSGAGKSSLLKIIAGLIKPNAGSVLINKYDLTKINNINLPYFRRQIGLIFQETYLLEEQTIFNNVALPLIIANLNSNEIPRKVRAALNKVCITGKEKLYPSNLSQGEKQRVSIARAIVNKPPILLADEPTGNLDPELSLEIMKLFQQLNQVGVTVVIATHDLDTIRKFNNKILCLSNGELISYATTT